MRHFGFLAAADLDRLFLHAPHEFGVGDEPALLAVALGATLYSPATRPRLAEDISRRAGQGVTSLVVCLEDAIADAELAAAEQNTLEQLRRYAATCPAGPMLFVRVRAAEQIPMIVAGLGEHTDVLTGFVLPKFTDETGGPYFDEVIEASATLGRRLLAMPVLESPEVIFAETRTSVLLAVRELLDKHRDYVLAVRLGATDLSAAYGLRRTRDLTVYDVRVVADAIADVVNIFGRVGPAGYVVTGPVWEYFPGAERLFKPQLRETLFAEHAERTLGAELIARDLDGLLREVALDRANGLTGKTVIHPSHVAAVHALSVVTHEEYVDCLDIVGSRAVGGAMSSAYGNKMNESKPHTAWAERTLLRGRVFGVAHEGVSFVDLLAASLHR